MAVVFTLGYLALQVRGAKRAMISAAYQGRSEIATRSTESIYNSDYMPEIFARCFFEPDPPPLTGAEFQRLIAFIQNQHRIFENFSFQCQQGVLDQSVMDAHIESLRNSFFFDNDLARWQWGMFGREVFDQHYRELVDRVFAEKEPTHKVLHLTPLAETEGPVAAGNDEGTNNV